LSSKQNKVNVSTTADKSLNNHRNMEFQDFQFFK